jgi:hypothetical protein
MGLWRCLDCQLFLFFDCLLPVAVLRAQERGGNGEIDREKTILV